MKPILCIPSYSRPDGIAIERCKDLPIEKFLFIRKGQKDLYKKWAPYYHLVLQTKGTDIGLVRKNIVKYCSIHGFEWAFVLDDDIQKVEVLGKKADGKITAQRIIDGISGPRMEMKALKKWFKCAVKNNLALSSPNHRAHDRFSHGTLRINKSACIQCVLLHIPDIVAAGSYKSIHDTGNEDYYLQYNLMRMGFLTAKLGNIEYDCPGVGVGEGGNNTEEYTDLNEKYEEYVNTFLQNVCNDPKYITTKTSQGGQKSIQFVWKNWNGSSTPMELEEKD